MNTIPPHMTAIDMQTGERINIRDACRSKNSRFPVFLDFHFVCGIILT